MGRNTKITVAAILSLVIAGCASEETPVAVNSTPNPSVASPNTADPNVVANLQPTTPTFKNPVVPAQQVPQLAAPTLNKSLIQPTNARERIVMVSKGRTDPFSQIGGQPISQFSTNPMVKTVPNVPRLPIPVVQNLPKSIASQPKTTRIVVRRKPTSIAGRSQQKTKIALVPLTQRPKPPSASFLPKVLPQVVPNPTLVSVLPPTEKPELARAILVTGIVQIGREPQAIIKVPDEPTSRYVQAGQRLVNGVLVKRIEMNQGSNPVVILEQYGIEVARMVGEAPVIAKPSTTASAGGALAREQEGIN
ncbi:hypothetical protein Cylst_4265 [Cylindrospermum stagnale PCC 7417]|uniref:Uncharacterized protein n=1 Tax=Cylindrospermum stagnale PCC 7417 TaxID=56107 RepID=K9X3T8_9NOST|nr:hypothetical protein [Cylindrospermum stagnale]AFZ26362.1 hypothetical protein Cylst_4265 [Cylindrospermum stagnale PCC 7417]